MPARHYLELERTAVEGVSWWRSWWRGLSKRDLTIAAVAGLCSVVFLFHLSPDSYKNAVGNSNDSSSDEWVPFKPLSNALQKSAFCLDGTVPGYHIRSGFGSGADNWLIHIEGGAWCHSISTCSARKRTKHGSSTYVERLDHFVGILSHDPLQNPDFFNWNKVKVRYCDGASFSSNPESEFRNGTELFFRGQLIWDAIMDELLSMGMSRAQKAFLTGCSAGALATLIHCDRFRNLLPKDTTIKCLSDGGFFLNEKDIARNPTIEIYFNDVVLLQGAAKSLNPNCVARSGPSKCFFPQEFIRDINTPVFLVQSTYDWWQVEHIFVPDSADPHDTWLSCRLNIFNCNSSQLEVLHGYRNSMLKTLNGSQLKSDDGLFINSCFIHCQTWMAETWHSLNSPRINNKTIAEAVGDWYFERSVVSKHIDCPFPCNPTCYNMKLDEVLH